MMIRYALAAVLAVLLAPHAFAAGRELAPRPLIPNSDHTVDIEVASAGNRFLTVWEVRSGWERSIYGSLSDANGHRISPSAFLIAEAARPRDGAIAVTGTGDAFAVFWIDGAHAVHLTDISLDGRILGTRTLALPAADHVSVAWNGDRFMVALFGERHSIDRGEGALLARDGTVVHGGIPLTVNANAAHVAVTGNGFIVFANARDFFAHAIAEDGSVTQSIAGDPGSQFVSAPLADGRLLVVYTLGGGQLRSAIWKDGAKLTEATIDAERGMVPAGILRGGDRHLLAFVARETLFTADLDDDGRLASEPRLAATDFRNARGAANDNVLLVPHRFQSVPVTPPAVVSVVIGRDRTVSDKETQSIRPAPQSHVLVGAGGGSMIGVWNEATAGGGSRIRSARIDRDFEPAEVYEVAPDGVLVARTLAWNGTGYMVLYRTSDARLLAARVAYDGAPIGEPRVLAETYDNRAAVTWAGDRWAVAWTELYGNIIRYTTVSHGGIPSPLQELNLTRNQIVDLALAFDGTRVHLGWIESASPYSIEPPPPGHAVFTTRLRRNGRVADAQPLAVPASSPRKLAMAGNGERVLLLVDEETRIAVNVIAAKTRQLVATRTLVEAFAHSDVTWDGYEFVAAVTYRTGDQSYAEVRNLGGDGTATNDARVTATLSRDQQVSVTSSPGYDAVLGLQDSDAALGRRAVIYPEREMFRLP